MTSIEKVLENIGFSPNEIKVYLTLNDRGSTPAGKIAKLAKIDRSSCYNSLKSLLEKGLVSYVSIGKIKHFQAVGPKRLLDYVKEQEQDVSEILPELHARHKAAKVECQVRLFKGIKGIKSIFLDMMRTKEDMVIFGAAGLLKKKMPEFASQLVRLRKENKIHAKIITQEDKPKISTSGLTEYKYVKIEGFGQAETTVYGKKIAIIMWTDEPEGMIIENEAMAKSYKSYFDLMWSIAKPK